MGTHSEADQEGTYDFIRGLGRQHDDLAGLARGIAELGRLAADNMPVSTTLSGDIIEVAAQLGRIAESAQTWEQVARAKQPRDIQRVEAPRGGSRKKEEAADVGRAMRET